MPPLPSPTPPSTHSNSIITLLTMFMAVLNVPKYVNNLKAGSTWEDISSTKNSKTDSSGHRTSLGSQAATNINLVCPPSRERGHYGDWAPESEKPRQRVSNADRKVFANPESFCNKMKNLRTFWKMSEYYTKYPDNMQCVRMDWKVSG